jgi:hypothetical protein
MFRRKVIGPDGRTWKVGRRWFPRYRKGKRVDMSDLSMPDLGSGADDLGIIGAILLAIGLLIAAVVLVLLAFNVVVIAIELLIVTVLFVAGLFGRVVLRKPWTVFAKSGDEVVERQVVGWRASKREIADLDGALASGLEPARLDRR